MIVVRVRRGARWAMALTVAGVGSVVLGVASNELTGSDVLLVGTVTLILIAGVAVMIDTMVCLTKQVTCDFAERIERNLHEMGRLREDLEATRAELVALQPKTEELAEEVASYAVFRCLTDPRTVLATTGTEDTGTHNVSMFRQR